MKYLVLYVEGCGQRVKAFKTKSEAQAFVEVFTKGSKGNADNWVDAVIQGSIIKAYGEWCGFKG